MLSGMQRLHKRVDARKPITQDILIRIILALDKTCSSFYETVLFSSCFSLAFFAFLRIGEFAETQFAERHIIHVNDVSVDSNGKNVSIMLSSSKTNQFGNKITLEIPTNKCENICPVKNMQRYLKIRPKIEGPLFCHLNHKTLTRYQVSSVLKSTMKFLNFDERDYNTHSFRIGAATSFALLEKSDHEIKKMGRWNSCAYLKYIRINSLD